MFCILEYRKYFLTQYSCKNIIKMGIFCETVFIFIKLINKMKFFKKIALSSFSIFILSISSVYAWGIDHFEVELTPKNAKVWEALDLEIKAVDKNNNIVNNYNWTILIFSESDPEAELPSVLDENTYIFQAQDQWKVKFENTVKFKEKWNQDIHIYDLNDDTVLWIWEVFIEEAKKEEISFQVNILSPESWLTIPNDKIKISGTSKKNHSIKIILNNDVEFKTTTNNWWFFEKEIDNLKDWENIFKAQILDSENSVVWESEEVKISVESLLPKLKNIKITPKEVEAESSFDVEIITSKWLSEVNVIINDTLTQLKKDERDESLWKKSIYAPSKWWNYKIDAVLKDEIWHETKEMWAENLVVKEKSKEEVELKSADVEKEEREEGVLIKSEKDDTKKDSKKDKRKKLKITWIKIIELRSKSIITWDKVDWAESYNVYKKIKKDDKDDLELMWNVMEPKFEIEFSSKEIKYDYFIIRAVARIKNKDEEGNDELYEWSLSDATKVKTWPEVLLLFLLALFIWWIFFFIKRKVFK